MKLKITASFCFSKQISHIEYYHNSSWLEYGGSPDKAVRSGFTAAFDKYLRDNNKYTKNENKIIFQDIQDSLVLVTNCFSTIGCFENQTKKSVNSKFTQDAMTAFFKEQLQVWFIENKQEADKASEQILVNKRARESAEKTKSSVKRSSPAPSTLPTGCRNLWTAAAGTLRCGSCISWRVIPHWAVSSSAGTRNFRALCRFGAKFSTA